jgi:hypothetical protein
VHDGNLKLLGVVDNIAALILGSGDDILIIRWASGEAAFPPIRVCEVYASERDL